MCACYCEDFGRPGCAVQGTHCQVLTDTSRMED